MIHLWAKKYVKYHEHDAQPVHTFLSDVEETEKYYLVICNAISKILLYHCKSPEKPRVLLLESTEIYAIKTGENNIHSGPAIKPGTKLLGLNDKSKAALRNNLSEVKLLIIDELSTESSDLWENIDSRSGKIFIMIPEKHLLAIFIFIF